MNCKKILTAALSLAGALAFATAANAQQIVLGVGSSALFPTVGIAALSDDPITAGTNPPCGKNLWSLKGSVGGPLNGIDPRGGTTAEPGNIWVVWDGTATDGSDATTICAYLSVDSLVGQRLFFAQGASGNGTLSLTTTAGGANVITGFVDTTATLPSTIQTKLNGAHFNVAFTDVRPEDGQYAYYRAANSPANGGFNYNPSGLVAGTPIWSSFSNTNAQVDNFHVSGNDPISPFYAIPSSTTVPLGASPIIIFYNNGNTATGGLGAALPTNILSKTAEKLWSGQIGGTQAVFNLSANTYLDVIQREPMSGTYNTFEFQLVHARDGSAGDSTQELDTVHGGTIAPSPTLCYGTPPAAFSACTNPLYLSAFNSIRYRGLGTGELVKAVRRTTTFQTTHPDVIGYAFYSLGSFAGATNLKYVKLQGVDALYGSYNGSTPFYTDYATNGLFPTCSGSINAAGGSTYKCDKVLPNFFNVQNGSYRVWSTLSAIVNTSAPLPPALVTTLIQASQDQAAYALLNPSLSGESTASTVITAIADFVPYQYFPSGTATIFLQVFRSHYGISGVAANNGTNAPNTFCAADQASPNCFEEGGNMAGVAFWRISDQSYYNATGSEFLTQIE